MRITSGGHLLVGKTSQDQTNTVGFEAKDTGEMVATTDGTAAGYFNRKTSDGTIVDFRIENSSVGNIGTVDADLVIYSTDSNHAGLRLGNGYVGPTNNSGAVTDGFANLGLPTVRWKDLYLSGGAYLGGTAAANHLDDYEEGTFTPAFSATGLWSVTLYLSTSMVNTQK